MPAIDLNGTVVELVPQQRDAYNWLASQVYRRMHDGPPLPGMLTMIALDGVGQQKIPTDDPRIQAILWTLWQLGIAKVTHDTGAQQINWEQGKHANITTRPFIEHFTEEGIAEGRALAAALSVVLQRTLRINGVELQVRAVDFDLLRAQSEELRKRQQDPKQDMAMAAARYLAELLAQGAGDKDLRFRAALELAADLGIRSLIVDAASRQLRIEGFNEQAALAAAFFQGLPVDQFETAVKRAQLLNQAAAETARRLSETARTGGEAATKAAAIGPKAGTQKQDPVKLEFRRRRR